MESKTIYILWETWASVGNVLVDVYQNEEDAKHDQARRKELRDASNLPEYDSWGLVSGIDYFIEKREIK